MKDISLEKLQWACRRGMLELDFILQAFLKNHYLSLSGEQRQAFQALLACADQDLFAYLVLKHPVSNKDLAEIVDIIRQHHVTCFSSSF